MGQPFSDNTFIDDELLSSVQAKLNATALGLRDLSVLDAVDSANIVAAAVDLAHLATEVTDRMIPVSGIVSDATQLNDGGGTAFTVAQGVIAYNHAMTSHDYALASHNHAADYAALTHNHNTDYYTKAQIDVSLAGKSDTSHHHNAVYATIGHNHTGVYSAVSHDHDSDYAALAHNHDSDYAALVHNHNTDYYTKGQVDTALTGKSDVSHGHAGTYAALSHNHTLSDVTDSGTAAAQDVGVAISNVVQLVDIGGGTPGMPAVDGSQLTGVTGGTADHGSLDGLADDDHTIYHTDARGDARYSALGHSHTLSNVTDSGTAAAQDVGTLVGDVVQLVDIGGGTPGMPAVDGSQLTGIAGGSSDHGALTGLGDDDHTQYHNDTRGDARYSLLAHNHSGTYATIIGTPTTDNFVSQTAGGDIQDSSYDSTSFRLTSNTTETPSAAAVTVDCDVPLTKVTLTDASTAITLSNGTEGVPTMLALTQGTGGSKAATWTNLSYATGDSAPTLSTAAGDVDYILVLYDGTSYLFLSAKTGF